MMRAKGRTGDGRPLLIIGLEAGNIERLKDGKPIRFDMASHGIIGECIIVYGETAEDCARQFSPIADIPAKGSA
jgi:hypothetical protein